MPDYAPPEACPGTPVVTSVVVGTRLWRVHSDAFEPTGFNATDPDSTSAGGGGRFDSPGGLPPYLYAASSIEAVLSETILRDLPFPPHGVRELPRRAIAGRCISEVVATRYIHVIALHGQGLPQVGQDPWIVHCGSADYPRTRTWAERIRKWAPKGAGYEWSPRHFDGARSYVLYEDMADGALGEVHTCALDGPEGAALIVPALHALNVAYPVG
jgi:hypothetical protein